MTEDEATARLTAAAPADVRALRAENARLRAEVARLEARLLERLITPAVQVLGSGDADESPLAATWRRNVGIAGVWDEPEEG